MQDRQPKDPGRIKITLDDGTVMYGKIERADSPSVVGTPLNKNTLFNSIAEERYAVETPSEAFNKMTYEILVNVPASGWGSEVDAEGWYTNQVVVPDMKAVFSPFMDIVLENPENASAESSAYNAVQRVETFDDYVVFKSTRIPSDDFTVKFRGV